MDLNNILIWMVALACFVMLFRLLRLRLKTLQRPLFIALFILLLLFTGIFIIPEKIGFIAAAFCIGMVLLPRSAVKIMQRWILQQKSYVLSRRLTAMSLVVLLQVIFDLMNPEVNFSTHLSGVIIEFIMVMLIGKKDVSMPEKGKKAMILKSG